MQQDKMHTSIIVLLFLIFATQCEANERWQILVEQTRVAGNQNDAETISREVNQELLSKPFRKRLGFPEQGDVKVTLYSDHEAPELHYLQIDSNTISSNDQLSGLGEKLLPYVIQRMKGHSRAYARWIAFEEDSNRLYFALPNAVSFTQAIEGVIGFPWVRADIKQTFALPEWKPVGDDFCVVVDGDLAWIYFGSADRNGRYASTCIDALEFMPGVQKAFESVLNEWKKSDAKTTQIEAWSFFKDRLRAKFGIAWRSPIETNPGVIFEN